MNVEDEAVLNQIESIRANNNSFWIEIVRIALEEAPERTKNVLNVINANDKEIGLLLERLARKP